MIWLRPHFPPRFPLSHHIRPPSSPLALASLHAVCSAGRTPFSVHASFQVQLRCHFSEIFPDTRLEFIAPSSVSPGHFAGVSYGPERALIQCLCTPTILEEGWEEPRETGSHLTPLACSSKPRAAWPWSFPPVLACIPNHSMLDLYALHIGVLLPRLHKDGDLSFKGQLLLCLRAEVFPRVPGRAMAPSCFYGFKFPVLAPPSTRLSPLSP